MIYVKDESMHNTCSSSATDEGTLGRRASITPVESIPGYDLEQ